MTEAAARYPQRRLSRPPGATEILLVRHGASAAAVPGEPFPVLDGHGDPPLAPEGEAQAEAVGAHLAAVHAPAALFVTGLRRTVQTAAPAAEWLGVEPVVVRELREVHLGDWEAGEYRIRLADGDPVALRALADERWDLIPGAESMEALARRVHAGIEAVVRAAGPDATVAAFVHGGVIGEICRQATGSRPFAFIHADNGSITRLFALPDGRRLLRSFNETAHLD